MSAAPRPQEIQEDEEKPADAVIPLVIHPKVALNIRKYKLQTRSRDHNMALPTLRPWHKTLALWMVQQPKKPKAPKVMAKAQDILNQPISLKATRVLLANPAFIAYCEEVGNDLTAQARAIAESRVVQATETHFEAIQRLYEQGEYQHIFKGTNPILERIWPVLEDREAKAQVIHITVQGHQTPVNTPVEVIEIAELVNEEVTP